MTSGEKCVWSAAFVAALYAHRPPMEAVRQGAIAVMTARQAAALGDRALIQVPTDRFILDCLDAITGAP